MPPASRASSETGGQRGLAQTCRRLDRTGKQRLPAQKQVLSVHATTKFRGLELNLLSPVEAYQAYIGERYNDAAPPKSEANPLP